MVTCNKCVFENKHKNNQKPSQQTNINRKISLVNIKKINMMNKFTSKKE